MATAPVACITEPVMGCHVTKQTRVQNRWMTRRAYCVGGIARHVVECHLTRRKRMFIMRVNDAAGNDLQGPSARGTRRPHWTS
jgi:hypothetical protein